MPTAAHDLEHTEAEVVRGLLGAPERLAALDRSRLLDARPEESYDRLTRIASRVLGVPVSLVSVVDDERQFFKSQVGLGEPWASARQTPLSHSFCQYVAANDRPLVVSDSTEDPLVRDNLAVPDLDVIAYAGVPFRGADDVPLGAFCAIDDQPRTWTDDDLQLLWDLAAILRDELLLRETLERSLQVERSQADTLAVLAHDLRSPLGVVRSTVRLLPRVIAADNATAQEQLLGAIDRQADNALELVDRLLTAAGRSADAEPVRETFDLADELASIVEDVSTSYPDTALTVVAPPRLEAHLDELWTRQIVDNLLGNAFAHAPGAAVEVRARDEDGIVVIEVEDEGPGMTPEQTQVIFERFTRGGSSSGYGLGLHIVHRLATAMDGTVEVRSTPGEGTTFEVRLPQ